MSEAERKLLLEAFERWNAGDRELPVGLAHEDVRLHSGMTNSTFEGPEGVTRWMAEIDEQFDGWKITLEEFRDVPGGRLLGLGTVEMRGRASGVSMTQPIAWIFAFEDGKVREFWTYPNQGEALRAAGLEPE